MIYSETASFYGTGSQFCQSVPFLFEYLYKPSEWVWGYELPNPHKITREDRVAMLKRILHESFSEIGRKVYIVSAASSYEKEAAELRDYISANLPEADIYSGISSERGIAIKDKWD